jgi:hypothetical protein
MSQKTPACQKPSEPVNSLSTVIDLKNLIHTVLRFSYLFQLFIFHFRCLRFQYFIFHLVIFFSPRIAITLHGRLILCEKLSMYPILKSKEMERKNEKESNTLFWLLRINLFLNCTSYLQIKHNFFN